MPHLAPHQSVPYLPIKRHGVIGDRQTAALVAADGTVDWLCLPDYAGPVFFGSLLDARQGGHWKLGPGAPILGRQEYLEETMLLSTVWQANGWQLELIDCMPLHGTLQPPSMPTLVRRLRCARGRAPWCMVLEAAADFAPLWAITLAADRVSLPATSGALVLWASSPIEAQGPSVRASGELNAGEEVWCVLAPDDSGPWSVERARMVLGGAQDAWRRWSDKLEYRGPFAQCVRHSARLVHLLSYAPAGSLVAAPTASLPERIGADWNADYRFAWVRDASLSSAVLPMLGNVSDCEHYLQWLVGRERAFGTPLQPLYGIHGERELQQHDRKDLYGYRGSRPVRFNNHAFRQQQHDAYGFLAECLDIYLEHGGPWRPEFWELLARSADFIADHWQESGNSIWELPVEQHYLSGKVMSWTMLDRAIAIGEKLRKDGRLDRWKTERERVRADVLARGWSELHASFKQRYEGDNLDAAALLVPLSGLLPAGDPRSLSTVDGVARELTIDGCVYRFDPPETPGMPAIEMGEYEGAFLPCTFWLARAYAQQNRVSEAETILARAEERAGPLRLFAEGVDPRSGAYLGNTPLLFSHVEFVRAALELGRATGTVRVG
jgi:GH15 family glucan-1,4-alpha-glucosidase